MAKNSSYQQNIIRNYYKNRSSIALQRLQELVTDLYLSEGKKREQCWKNIANQLEKLEVKPQRIKYLLEKNDPALIAQVVSELDKSA